MIDGSEYYAERLEELMREMRGLLHRSIADCRGNEAWAKQLKEENESLKDKIVVLEKKLAWHAKKRKTIDE